MPQPADYDTMNDAMACTFLGLIFIAVVAFAIFVNWTMRTMRNGMTEEEQKRHDEEITRDLRIW